MRCVEDDLVVGVAMNGGHDAADNAAMCKQNLNDRSKAVGGAAGVRNYVVLGGVVFVFIHAEHQGDVFIGSRSRDDDLLDGLAKVRLGFGCVGKEAGRFNHDLCANFSPIQLGGVALGIDLDLLAIDGDKVFAGNDFIFQVAEDRVVLEQVGQGGRAGQVVDGNKFNFRIAKSGAKNVAANAAEAIDTNLNCHE